MTLATTAHPTAFDKLDPASLESGIGVLVLSYQKTRSALIAWFVVRYAQALCHHPEFEGSDEERCAWQRVSRHWRWLAQSASSDAIESRWAA